MVESSVIVSELFFIGYMLVLIYFRLSPLATRNRRQRDE